MLRVEHTQAKSPPWRKYQLHQLLLQHEQQKHKGQDQRDNIQSNIYGLFLEENIMMNIFILATWQKGSRQSSCSSTRRASPRPPQTRPLHTVSNRSTFTSSYSQNVFSDETSTWKKSWWLPWDPEHWSDWKSHQGQGRLPKLSRRRPYLQPITFRLK